MTLRIDSVRPPAGTNRSRVGVARSVGVISGGNWGPITITPFAHGARWSSWARVLYAVNITPQPTAANITQVQAFMLILVSGRAVSICQSGRVARDHSYTSQSLL